MYQGSYVSEGCDVGHFRSGMQLYLEQVAASLCVLFFPSLCAEHWRHRRLLRLRHQSNVNCTASYSAAAILHDLLLRWPAHGSLTRSHAFILQCNTFRNGTRRVSIPLMPQRFLNRRPQSKNQIWHCLCICTPGTARLWCHKS